MFNIAFVVIAAHVIESNETKMVRIEVQPERLRWARKRAQVSVADLIRKFSKYHEWELGEVQPTLRQLQNFSKITHVPFGNLFLPEDPDESIPIPDFRTKHGIDPNHLSIDLLETINLCRRRQIWYREFAFERGDGPIEIIGSLSTSDDVVDSATLIRDALGLDLDARQQFTNWEDALRAFVRSVENQGILVMVSGVVGNNTRRRLDVREFRGFALADPFAPLIFINGADSNAARSFALAHELAHLWLGESAISDATLDSLPAHSVEEWCNQTAAELLVPFDSIIKEYQPDANLSSEVPRLSSLYKVSRLVVLRRLYDGAFIKQVDFEVAFEREIQRLNSLQRSSGGDIYKTLDVRASNRFIHALIAHTLEGRTSFTDAFRMLGIRNIATFDKLSKRCGIPG